MSININDDYKSYETEDLVVYWNADICEHSGICTMRLSKVFNVREKPWINVFGENTKKIIEIIEKCPSGALKYKLKKEVL